MGSPWKSFWHVTIVCILPCGQGTTEGTIRAFDYLRSLFMAGHGHSFLDAFNNHIQYRALPAFV